MKADTDRQTQARSLAAEWETLNAEVDAWEARTRASLPRGSRWPRYPTGLSRRLSAWRKGAKAVAGWDERSRPLDGVLLYVVRRAAGQADA